jgi:hypothetical protein
MDKRKMKPKKIPSHVLVNVFCEIEWTSEDRGDNMLIKKMKL